MVTLKKRKNEDSNCKYCKGIVHKDSTICPHCGSHLTVWSIGFWKSLVEALITPLTLILAIISILTISIPYWSSATRPAQDLVTFSLVEINSESNEIIIRANNAGNASATLKSSEIILEPQSAVVYGSSAWPLVISSLESRMIRENDQTLITLKSPTINIPEESQNLGLSTKVELRITVIRNNESNQSFSLFYLARK